VSRKRIVVAGLGDTGIHAARVLAAKADVVGISVKQGLVSGQELGMRVARPEKWTRDYLIGFGRFRGLDPVRILHGALDGIDLEARTVSVRTADGTVLEESYDALLIATGVSNGFWRTPTVQSSDEVAADLRDNHDRLARAARIAVVGGGIASVSAAANLARAWPDNKVDLYFPGAHVLPGHHPKTAIRIEERLVRYGVGLHPGHRAVLPADHSEIGTGPIGFSTGQSPAAADAVLWAVGKVRPNTEWLPAELLDDDGFVRVTPELQVVDHRDVYAVGDVAASDPLRTSARNGGALLVARNILASFDSRPLRRYRPPAVQWGSVFGPQPDGLELFTPWGQAVPVPNWVVDKVLIPIFVRRFIYGGVRA